MGAGQISNTSPLKSYPTGGNGSLRPCRLKIAPINRLNPVRAGVVVRPEDYRWCSFAYHPSVKKITKAMGIPIKAW